MKLQTQRSVSLVENVTQMQTLGFTTMAKMKNRGHRYLKRTRVMVSARHVKVKKKVADRRHTRQNRLARPFKSMRSKFRTTQRMALLKISMRLRKNRESTSLLQIQNK